MPPSQTWIGGCSLPRDGCDGPVADIGADRKALLS